MAVDKWAKVAPFTLQSGIGSCPTWLHQQLHGPGSQEPFHRWDIRNRLVYRLRDAHSSCCAPTPEDLGPVPPGMLAEQSWFYRRFATTYCMVFADEPGEALAHGCESSSEFGRRHLRVGGGVDLLIARPAGTFELRQLELWGGPLCADPYSSWEINLAVLRLRQANRDLRSLLIRHVDLDTGELVESQIDLPSETRALAAALDDQVAELRSRASSPTPIPGRSCGLCNVATSCPAWRDRPTAPIKQLDPTRTDFVGSVVHLTPTSIDRWLSCPRAYRAAHLLDLPRPRGARASQGLIVHARLAQLHQEGPCPRDLARQLAAATFDGVVDEVVAGFITRHARRCPSTAVALGHELDLAQLHTWGNVPAMVTARIDALWIHDGVLDCRDYKTGPPWLDKVAEDPGARLQAWLLAPLAAERGLRLRLQYEHLAEGVEEDPEPFEPELEDVIAIRDELGVIASEISESDFGGVSDEAICRRCVYRFACPDAVLSDPDEDETDDSFVIRSL